ncbi:hypothetical protein ACLMJK_008177 [Lecanora helva]
MNSYPLGADLVINFEPHGLIASPYLELNYRSTSTYPREVHTLNLMENLFNKVLFRDRDDVTVNSVSVDSLKTSAYEHTYTNCHCVVKYLDSEHHMEAEMLCFTDDIQETRENLAVQDFENRVIRHCRDYLEKVCLGRREFVYVCTAFGNRLRIWKYFKNDYEFFGMWGGYGLTEDVSSYLDVGDDENSTQIKQALNQITNESSSPGDEQVTSIYPGRLKKMQIETIPRKVDAYVAQNENGETCRFFYCQGKEIGTKPSDWVEADSKLFSKKRLIYKKDRHNVWTDIPRFGI